MRRLMFAVSREFPTARSRSRASPSKPRSFATPGCCRNIDINFGVKVLF